ncbi:MAG TPA: trigger factor [Patescibacteria group bacterium]|jgi:FKBP-type peptidyl-prolyl cis-trans isomerase (trigger factor)|nr:trigger factor [Patescibacteria group bacterium]
MKSILARQEDGTIQLTITIPWSVVKKAKEVALEAYLASSQLPGFRKGKAPKKLVEDNLNQDHLREEVLRKLLPEGYVEALKEHALKPILNPKIHVEKLEDDKDWTFTAFTAEAPIITLGDYKEAVKKVTAKSKIVVPGKEQAPANFEDIAKAILETATVRIPKIIIDQEVDRLLAQTLDEVKRLGLTLDQYLASTGRNTEALRQEYEKKAENDIKLEFLLQKIAEDEKITVEEKEIDEAITQAKTDAEKQNLQNNRYLLASIIRQQKTLDFLRSL